MDFGRLGMITDPATGKGKVVWALIIVLSYSRHCFVWPTHSQKLEDVIAGLEAAWAFFGGVPRYLVIDNFPAAVAGADRLHPRLTRAFWNTPSIVVSSSIRRGSVIPRTSPKWSGACPTSGSASSRAAISTDWLTCALKPSAGAWRWRASGSTARRDDNHWWSSRMRSAIPCSPGMASPTKSPTGAPPKSIPIITWPASTRSTRCRHRPVHRVRRWKSGWTASWCASTTGASWVKVHQRQPKGGRATDVDDYPAELSAYTMKAPDRIKRSAALHGPAVAEFTQRLFDDRHPWSKIRQGHKLIRPG